jgi:pimeloyl-ACP methyl ester carboxylesterase
VVVVAGLLVTSAVRTVAGRLRVPGSPDPGGDALARDHQAALAADVLDFIARVGVEAELVAEFAWPAAPPHPEHRGDLMPEAITVVLVHGAFAESASWTGVITRLQDNGVAAIATPNPLRSVTTDAENVRRATQGIGGPILLVGHSYGGTVITEAAVDNPDVIGLVYVAAFAPDPRGELAAAHRQFPGSTLGDTVRSYPLGDGTNDLVVDPGAVPAAVRGRRPGRGRRRPGADPAPDQGLRPGGAAAGRHPRPGSRCRRGPSSGTPTRTSRSRGCGSWPSERARSPSPRSPGPPTRSWCRSRTGSST